MTLHSSKKISFLVGLVEFPEAKKELKLNARPQNMKYQTQFVVNVLGGQAIQVKGDSATNSLFICRNTQEKWEDNPSDDLILFLSSHALEI